MGQGWCKRCEHSEGSYLTELVYCQKYKFSIHEFHEGCEDFIFEKSCFRCKFHDGVCCMYECACKVTLDETDMAHKCEHYCEGRYNQEELEKTDYK
jgi:hypothetical protein